MTKQFKKILLLTLYGIFIFSFINCEYDIEVPVESKTLTTKRKFTIKKVLHDEVIQNYY